jgi:uncharacterized protein involved in exopolysaccharide biosynthesis
MSASEPLATRHARDADIAAAVKALPGTLRRRWRVVAIVFTVVAVGAVAGAYLTRHSYGSTARLLVKLEQRSISLSQSEVRYEQASKVAEEAVATQAEMLSSPENIRKVIETLGPGVLEPPPPTSWFGIALRTVVQGTADALEGGLAGLGLVTRLSKQEAAIEYVAKNIRINPVRRTQIIEVSFRSRTPQAAHRVLDELIGLHMAKLAQVNAFSEGYGFYRKQADELLSGLRVSEAELAQFKRRHAVIDAPAEKAMLMQKIERMTSSLEGSLPHHAVDAAPVPVGTAAGSDAGSGRGLVMPIRDTRANLAGNELSQMVARLNELKLERIRRIALYEPTTPMVQEIDNQVVSLERMLDSEVRQMRSLINAYKARLAALDGAEAELFRLQRAVTIGEGNYKTYLQAAEDRRISEQEQGRTVVMLFDKPSVAARPLPPSRLVILLTGLGFALAAALAAGVMAEWADRRRRPQRP